MSMDIKLFLYFLLLGILTVINLSSCNGDESVSRAIDMAAAWRPLQLAQSLGHSPTSQLISIASLDTTNKAHLIQIAHHNAQILRKLKELNHPITQYHNPNPYQLYGGSTTPKYNPNPNQPKPAASNIVLSSVPNFASNNHLKTGHYINSGKTQFLGKPELSPFQYITGVHSSTPKIPSLVKQHPGFNSPVNTQQAFHHGINAQTANHYPSSIYRDVTLTPPPVPQQHQTFSKSTLKPHPVLNKLQSHLALATKLKQPSTATSNRLENFSLPAHILSSFSNFGPAAHLIRDSKPKLNQNYPNYPPLDNSLKINNGYQSNVPGTKHFITSTPIKSNGYYYPNPTSYSASVQGSAVLPTQINQINPTEHANADSSNNIKASVAYPNIPPSVLTPILQHVHQQNIGSTAAEISHPKPSETPTFQTIHDEFSQNLVPPPYKHRDSSQFREKPILFPTAPALDQTEEGKAHIELLNKYNLQAISPLQDTNRYAYNTGPLSISSTQSTIPDAFFTVTAGKPVSYDTKFDTYFTTEKPNVFKHLNRPTESEYKQHKLMHPNYTGAKKPGDLPSSSQPFLPTPQSEDLSVTHSFFTIADAITGITPNYNNVFPDTASPSVPPVPTTSTFDTLQTVRPTAEVITEPLLISTQEPTPEIPVTVHKLTSTLSPSPIPSRGKTKMRRRRPKPQVIQISHNDNQNAEEVQNNWESKINENSGYRHETRNRNRGRPAPDNVNEVPPTRGRRPIGNNQPVRTRQEVPPKPQKVESDTTYAPEETTINIADNPFLSNLRNARPNRFKNFLPSSEETQNLPEVRTRRPVFSSTYSSRNRIGYTTTTPVPQRASESNTVLNEASTINHFSQTEVTANNDVNEQTTLLETTPAGRNTVTTFKQPEYIATEKEPVRGPTETTAYDHMRHRTRLRYKVKENQQNPKTTENVEPEENTNEIAEIIETNKPGDTENNSEEEKKSISNDGDKVTVKLSNTVSKLITTVESVTDPAQTTTPATGRKSNRIRPIGKFDIQNRPRFSVKDYRNRLSTTSTTEHGGVETSTSGYSRIRFPTRTRNNPSSESKTATSDINEETKLNKVEESVETSTEGRKRFSPKETRSRMSTTRSTTESSASTTAKSTTPRRGSTRRDFINRNRVSTTTAPLTATVEAKLSSVRNSSFSLRRPHVPSLRQRIQNFNKKKESPEIEENKENQDELINLSIESKSNNDPATEEYRHETSIMKIAKDDHSYRPYAHKPSTETSIDENDLKQSPSEYSQRVAELTLSGSGGSDTTFKSVNTGIYSRRIPGYFTLATEDPILPIEAFFSQASKE